MPVYFLEAVGLDLVKIGASRDVAQRLKSIDTDCPVRVRLVRVLDIDNERPGGGRKVKRHALETRRKRKDANGSRYRTGSTSHRVATALHDRFAAHSVRGEWFRFSPIRKAIAALDTKDVAASTLARIPCNCGRPLLAASITGKCHVCELIGRKRSPERFCVDCGKPRKVKGVHKLGRCRECYRAHATKEAQRKVDAKVCAECGKRLHPESPTMLCRGCAMREAWKDPEYRRRRGESQRAAINARRKKQDGVK